MNLFSFWEDFFNELEHFVNCLYRIKLEISKSPPDKSYEYYKLRLKKKSSSYVI